jgi:hypothetical protein
MERTLEAPVVTIDWVKVEKVAKELGPRTRGLVRARNVVGLRGWLAYAVAHDENWPPSVALLYERLFELLTPKDGAR